MAFTEFKDMDMDVQIDILHTAVKELQSRFQAHRHAGIAGKVTVDLDECDYTALDGKFVEDDC